MKKSICLIIAAVIVIAGCEKSAPTADQRLNAQQEQLSSQAVSAVGVPGIKNFFMKKELKQIIEMCDDPSYVTYTYIVAEQTGKLIFLGRSIGYGIPAATQFTSPERPSLPGESYEHGQIPLPQQDPDGLYKPSSSEGTWVLLLDPNGGKDVKPLYVEPRVIVSPFALNEAS